jgi:hypothetical protein
LGSRSPIGPRSTPTSHKKAMVENTTTCIHIGAAVPLDGSEQ